MPDIDNSTCQHHFLYILAIQKHNTIIVARWMYMQRKCKPNGWKVMGELAIVQCNRERAKLKFVLGKGTNTFDSIFFNSQYFK